MIEDGLIDTSPSINARLRLVHFPRDFESLLEQWDLIKAMVEVEDSYTTWAL